jgi:CP family cyanate transporter-like MFS transporter
MLVALSIPIGIGIGVAGAILPAAASEQKSMPATRATSLYALGIQVGATLSAATAVPLAVAGDSWRFTLAAFAIFNGFSVIVWAVAWRPTRSARGVRSIGLLRPERGAARLAVLFALQSFAYYATVAWLPAALIEAGWGETDAGSVLAVLNFAAILGTFATAGNAGTPQNRATRLAWAAGLLAAGMALILVVPDIAYVAGAAVGLSFGLMFPLVLMLPIDAGRSEAHTVRLAAAMLALGYAASAMAPSMMGLVRDATGSFVAVLGTLAIVGVLEATFALRWRTTPLRTPEEPATGGG